MKGTQRVRADIVRDTVLDIRVRRREGSQELRKGYNPRAWGYRGRIRMVDRVPRRRGPRPLPGELRRTGSGVPLQVPEERPSLDHWGPQAQGHLRKG